jgi:hypothetical protein
MIEVDGTLYLGIYTGAHFYGYDGETLTHLGKVDGQVRPMDFVHTQAANAIMMGTQPNYGAATGGAIGVLDLSTHDVTAHKNVVEDQSIAALAESGGAVFAGGHTRRGHGTERVTSTAKLARFDVENMEKQWEIEPVSDAAIIRSLFASENRVIGFGAGTAFAVDPEDGTVEATADVGPGQQHHRGSDGRYYGVAYPSDADKESGIVRIDPEDMSVTRFQGEDIHATGGESTLIDGTMYWVDTTTWTLQSFGGVTRLE